MAYYTLADGFEMCGWKGLPFGLRHPNPRFTDFFDKEAYRVVYALDGRHDIDEETLTEKQKKTLDILKEIKIAVPSDGTKRLEPWQEYKSFPAIDQTFDSMLEKPLSDILSDSFYRDMCLLEMGECIEHNEKCRNCEYRLACGAGCRAGACGETGTDYMAIDEECCHFFKNGWYEKALEIIEKYKDS